MRIISGSSRGTKLYTLEGQETRPTLDRVKESLFNIINFDLIDSIFVDLFGGCGAIGLEAASRGAKEVIICEKSLDAVKIINQNIEKTKLNEKVKLYNMDYEKFIKEKIKQVPDYIYIDPPYKTDYAYKAVKLLIENKLIKKETTIIIETDIEQIVERQLKDFEIMQIKNKKYGRVSLLFYTI